jgi:hypothetical protein
MVAKAMGVIVDADEDRRGGVKSHRQRRAGRERTDIFG